MFCGVYGMGNDIVGGWVEFFVVWKISIICGE